MTAAPKTVDEYLARLPARERKVLERIRAAIRDAAPEAEERISYRIPMYRDHGHLVGFAAFKHHLSLFVTDSGIGEEFAAELEPYTVDHTTIRFSAEDPIPEDLVKRIVRIRLRENRELAKR